MLHSVLEREIDLLDLGRVLQVLEEEIFFCMLVVLDGQVTSNVDVSLEAVNSRVVSHHSVCLYSHVVVVFDGLTGSMADLADSQRLRCLS